MSLDPDLLRLFDKASVQTALPPADDFVSATLLRLQQTARARLIRRYAFVGIIMALGAILAPYMAQATLGAVDWLAEHLTTIGMAIVSPIGCVCAALLAWRIAHRAY